MSSEKIRLEDLEESFSRVLRESVAAAQTSVAETVGGVLLRGARPVPFASAAGLVQLLFSAGAVVGVSLREVAGAAAVLRLRDGRDAAGPIVATFPLVANAGITVSLGPIGGVFFANGLIAEIVSGQVEGAVYIRGTD